MSIPSSLLGVQRQGLDLTDRDCRLFKVQVASLECPPPRPQWNAAAVIADYDQFKQNMSIVAALTEKRVIETTTILMRAAAEFGAAALKSHNLVTAWRDQRKAEPCPDPRGRSGPDAGEEFGGADVLRLEEQFRVYTEQFLCLASQVASVSANMRASVSIVGLPTKDYALDRAEEDATRRADEERDALAAKLAEAEDKIRRFEEENTNLRTELQKIREGKNIKS